MRVQFFELLPANQTKKLRLFFLKKEIPFIMQDSKKPRHVNFRIALKISVKISKINSIAHSCYIFFIFISPPHIS